METVIWSFLEVVLLVSTVTSAPATAAAAAATAYYAPIVPYGPYPAPGYIVSSYLPKYPRYHVLTPVRYSPRKPKHDKDRYKDDEPKYYYGGKFKGVCSVDGLYYKDEVSFIVCSNGYASRQPCPPGTKTDSFPSYKPGYYYGSSDLCSMNLVDFGYGPYSYMPQIISYENDATNLHKEKPTPSYGSDTHKKHKLPRKETYQPSHNSYDSSVDTHSTSYDNSVSNSYQAVPSHLAGNSYTSSTTYSVDHPYAEYTYSSYGVDSYHSPPDEATYSSDSYSSRTNYDQKNDPYKPSSQDAYESPKTDGYYEPYHHPQPSKPVGHHQTKTASSYANAEEPYQAKATHDSAHKKH